MIEEWRDIEGFGGFYQVSNMGRVRSRGNGYAGRKPDKWYLRSLSANHDGYLKVYLNAGGKTATRGVHTLVAKAFIPNPDNFNTVNHKDGDKTNNNVDNLEWADRSQQMIHAYKLGLKKAKRGSSNYAAKLTDENVRYIRGHYVRNSKEFGTVALGRKFGVSSRVIGLITRGLSYTDVK